MNKDGALSGPKDGNLTDMRSEMTIGLIICHKDDRSVTV